MLAADASGWAIMFCTSVAGYGLITWLPTIYRTVYHLEITSLTV